MGPLELLVIYGSVRHNRQGIKAARFILGECTARGHRATLVDPIEEKLPLLDRMYKEFEPGQAPEALTRLAGRVKAADAFIIVSGEYNHSIPPALSNLLDHFLEEYFWRPSAIVCYSAGAFGGVRAAVQLRAMLCELGTPSIPSLLPVPAVQDAFDEEGRPKDEAYHRRAARFLDELEWYAHALKAARQAGVPYCEVRGAARRRGGRNGVTSAHGVVAVPTDHSDPRARVVGLGAGSIGM